MKKSTIYIVVINYKTYDSLRLTLQSILKSRPSKFYRYVITVVDQKSNSQICHIFEKEYPQCTFLKTNKNLGVGGAFNIGITYALSKSADYILLLPVDISVESSTLEALYLSMQESSNIGLVCPTVLYKTNPPTILYAGGILDRKVHSSIHFFSGEIHGAQGKNVKEVEILSCPVLLRKGVVSNIGMWRTEYFMYYEDIDYYLRATRFGYICKYVPTAIALTDAPNLDSTPSALKKEYYLSRNLLYFNKFNYPFLKRTIAYVYISKGALNLLLDVVRNKNRMRAKYKLLGIRDFILEKKDMKVFNF